MKFSVLKVFYIIYYVSTDREGISSAELIRKLGLRQKTCRSFKQKVMKAIQSSGKHKIVDEAAVGGQEEGVKGRKNGKKKLAVFAIERQGNGTAC